MSLFTVIRRAFVSNLGKVSATSAEQASLEAAGVQEPTIQHYLAWRRSMVVMVVIATIVSAVLTTFRTLTDADERSLCSAVAERLLENAQTVVPAAGKAIDAGTKGAEDEEDADKAQDDLSAQAKGLLKDAQQMLATTREAEGTDLDKASDDLLAKGKNLLTGVKERVAAASAAANANEEAEEDEEDEEEEPTTVFGMFADGVHLASLYAVPLAALASCYWWTRFRLTSRILVIAWAFSFFIPILVALCPWSWWGYADPAASPGKQQGLQYYRSLAEGFLEGIDYLITLLPIVLSLIPGVQRACLRVKTLLPESMLPGWFLVAAGPLYALFLLVVFVAIDQIASHPLLFLGMFFLLASPLVYVVRADAVTRPLIGDEDYRRLRHVQSIAGGMTLLACILLVVYLTTREVFGVHLIGRNPETSLLGPLDLVEYGLEFIGRLLFMTVVGADLFMRMNLAAWNNFKLFMRSGRASDYDHVMQAMEHIAHQRRAL
jgi:lysylphosphatidylglycerol synthetase-like protein (DUF2156 family)